MLKLRSVVRKVPAESLFVSQPHPSMFGNDDNPSKDPNWTNANWLKSRFHFQFAESRKPPSNFGVLRVLNDDLVQPNRGFGKHGHANMEIATFVMHGELTHQDSMGTKETLGRGSVQYMSAGSGVRHSEHNLHPTQPLRFLQLWVVPDKMGVKPNYGGYDGTTEEAYEARHNQLHHVISDNKSAFDTPIKLHQDVNMYIAELDANATVDFQVELGRQAYFMQAEGDSTIQVTTEAKEDKVDLVQYDAAELFGPLDLTITSKDKPSYILIVEMKYVGDSRF